jgi:transcriptional regulator with XRE-family HTH domain
MSNIPKDLPERIKYLREQKEMSQSDLAKRIGIDASRLSRIENCEIQKVSDDVVLAIAQIFEVSTDFLLGVTDDPVPSNFHINELGLSVDAAKKIYSCEVDVDILNILIESKDFGTLTKMISAYFTDTTDAAIASQNQILKMVGEILGDAVDDDVLAQINLAKIQNQQNDLIAIQRGFTSILKNIKEKMNTGMKKSQKMTAEIIEQIRNNLSRGKGALPYRIITAEKMVDSVIAAMGNIGGATQEMKNDLHKALMPFFLLAAKKK